MSVKSFKSNSQAGQDRFVFEMLVDNPWSGYFLDIGAGHPIEINNTYALEQIGWDGVGVEQDQNCIDLWRLRRSNPCLKLNAETCDWGGLPDIVGYLSLDCNESTLAALKSLPWNRTRFRVMTIETDAYRFGNERRDEMVRILKSWDYDILCSDVMDQGMPFEIWAVDPKLVDMKIAERFRRDKPTEWTEFFQ